MSCPEAAATPAASTHLASSCFTLTLAIDVMCDVEPHFHIVLILLYLYLCAETIGDEHTT